jgi:hypothetical protein
VNMYVGSLSLIVSFIVSCKMVNFALSIFQSHGSLNESFMFLFFSYILYLTTSLGLSSSLGFDGMKVLVYFVVSLYVCCCIRPLIIGICFCI